MRNPTLKLEGLNCPSGLEQLERLEPLELLEPKGLVLL
jgi:hypothetical protein